jgi:hypothetical protein
LKDVSTHGGVVSELILDKRVAGYSGTFNFTSYPADGVIFQNKGKYIISGQISSALKIIDNFFSSPPVGLLRASESTFYNLKLAIVAALVCTFF